MKDDDLRVRWIAIAFAATAAVIVGAVAIAHALAQRWDVAPPPHDRAAARAVDGVRFESAPQSSLEEYRREQQRRLESIGWVDPERGIAHIPIEAAMALLIERSRQDGSR